MFYSMLFCLLPSTLVCCFSFGFGSGLAWASSSLPSLILFSFGALARGPILALYISGSCSSISAAHFLSFPPWPLRRQCVLASIFPARTSCVCITYSGSLRLLVLVLWLVLYLPLPLSAWTSAMFLCVRVRACVCVPLRMPAPRSISGWVGPPFSPHPMLIVDSLPLQVAVCLRLLILICSPCSFLPCSIPGPSCPFVPSLPCFISERDEVR
ncbi:hypothetical protein K438DRAFT_447442 [Mycena galopus ATCC 62051]|nr:hypothetical protein K438DRAFT_447442 [Mycena galopus ATCC 62051]